MTKAQQESRPLSPHLQIYKLQITSGLSILHRGTGIVLFAGALLAALWYIALSQGPDTYHMMQGFLFHPLGLLILLGWSFSFFYHLCNGIRHLFWDIGLGYDMPTVRKTGWTVVVLSFLLTSLAWVLGIFAKGLFA